MNFTEIICFAAAILFFAQAANATNNDRYPAPAWKQTIQGQRFLEFRTANACAASEPSTRASNFNQGATP